MVDIIGYRILRTNDKGFAPLWSGSFDVYREDNTYPSTTKVAEPYAFSGLPVEWLIWDCSPENCENVKAQGV